MSGKKLHAGHEYVCVSDDYTGPFAGPVVATVFHICPSQIHFWDFQRDTKFNARLSKETIFQSLFVQCAI